MVVSVAVEKGGAGKTTTTGNLAAAIAATRPHRKVLCVDWDPQANLTRWLLPSFPEGAHIANVVIESARPHAAVHSTPWAFDVLAGHRELAGRIANAERDLQHFQLRQVLEPLRSSYDLILIDCPPKLDLLSINALAAADAVLLPVELGIFGADGLTNTLDAIARARQHLNAHLSVAGIVANKADLRTRHQGAVLAAVRRAATERHIELYDPPVPNSIVLAEACYHHVPIQHYKTRNNMARHCADVYTQLARQLLRAISGEAA